MAYQVLSLKWRPTEFEQVVGQTHITQALSNAIKLNRLAHAFTFSGPRGVGKTTTARILAKKINKLTQLSDSLDVIEMDAASNRGIDEIRNLKENINFSPAHGKYKIYIIDEVHMLTKEAFNALLKTLEEPPEYVVFILATTEIHKMPETIISRTQRFEFKRLTTGDIMNQMSYILKEEKIECDQDSLRIIAQKSDGSMRDALSILDQMICYCDSNITYDKIERALGIVSNDLYLEILHSIGKRECGDILSVLHKTLNNGVSINSLISGFSNFLRNCLLLLSSSRDNEFNKSNGPILKDDIPFTELDLLRILNICLSFQLNIKNYRSQDLALEVLMIKLAYLDKTIDIHNFIEDKKNNIIKNDINLNNGKSSKDIVQNILASDKKEIANEVVNKEIHDDENKNISKNINKIIDIVDESSEDDSKETADVEADKNEKFIDIVFVKEKWFEIKDLINKNNSKTAMFLENSEIEKIEDNKLFIIVNEMNNFSIKALEKDKDLIQTIICDVLDCKLQLILSYNILEKEIDESKESMKNENDEDHPLFMEALDKFKGKLIK